MNYSFLKRQPEIIQKFLLLFIQVNHGFRICNDSFYFWLYIISHDVESLNKKCFGLTVFDNFYEVLNGSWSGDR
jgi:hypothetical protein